MLHFIQMIGVPGSGKTEQAKELSKEFDAIVISSDTIRKELTGNSSNQTVNDKVFKEMFKRTTHSLAAGKSVIYDATNINYKRRKTLLQQLRLAHEIYAIAVVMATPIQMCIDRQNDRTRSVGEDVIWKMVKGFHIPYWYEGWDYIQICYPKDDERYQHQLYRTSILELKSKTSNLYEYNQKNPHHQLSLGGHLYKCYESICKATGDETLREAALLHDIGKPYVQSFKDEIAHYYSHHNASAYLSLFEYSKLSTPDRLLRVNYIQWHMEPYFWKLEKTRNKYKKLFGEEFYKNLMLLHNCDIEAH